MPMTDLECPNCGGALHTDDLVESTCVTPGCGHEFTREFYEEHGVSKAYWDPEMFRNTRHEIVEQLRNGDRDFIEDADKIESRDEDCEAVHLARDGSITIRFTYYTAYEGTEAGQVIEFDLLDPDDG